MCASVPCSVCTFLPSVYLCTRCPVQPLLSILTNVSVSTFNGTLPFQCRTPAFPWIRWSNHYRNFTGNHQNWSKEISTNIILDLKYSSFKKGPCDSMSLCVTLCVCLCVSLCDYVCVGLRSEWLSWSVKPPLSSCPSTWGPHRRGGG